MSFFSSRGSFRLLLKRHPLRVLLGLVIVGALVFEGVRYWEYLESYVDTEDAQVEANISQVSPRIQGTVIHTYVHDTQFVKKGQLLAELDPRDYELAVERARAALAEANANVQSARGNYLASVGKLNEDEAKSAMARTNAGRYTALLKAHVTTRQQYDNMISADKVAAATVKADIASAAAAKKIVSVREAAVQAAKAALDQASLNLSYTKIYAPVGGVVGNKTVEVGERVQSGQGLLAITSLKHLWVTANFKETELGEIRPGEPATIYVDALGRSLDGSVEGLGGATGALYSLLPPENATGNWIKVVQRLPVRIEFEQDSDPPQQLRPGLSVEVKVWVR